VPQVVTPPLGGIMLAINPNDGQVKVFAGFGDPNVESTDSSADDLAATSVGSLYLQIDGSTSTSLYVKTASIAGTTGTGTGKSYRAKTKAAHLFKLMVRNHEKLEEVRALIAPSANCPDVKATRYREQATFFEQFIAGEALPAAYWKPPYSKRAARKRRNPQYTGRRRRFTDEQIQLAEEALRSGARTCDVAARFDISTVTLLRRCRHPRTCRRREAVPRKEKAPRGSAWRKLYGQFGRGQREANG
jgi:transposase-like protein